MTNNYNIQESKRVAITMNWLGHEDLICVKMLNDEEQEKYKTSAGLFGVLSDKFKPEHNEMILSLQYCKLAIEQNEEAENGWAASE